MRAHLGAALILLLAATVPAALVFHGCGASSGGDGAVTPASRSPGASSPAVATNEAETIAAYARTVTRLEEPGAVDELMALYADDARMEDRAYGATSLGGDQIRSYWTRAATRAHAAIFAVKGIAFVGDETVAGPGWAAVMWRRTDREGRRIAFPDLPDVYLRLAQRPTIAGVTVLEVRDGKIARETVYCDHLRTRL